MFKKFIIFSAIFFLFFTKAHSEKSIYIDVSVNDEILTNLDIEKESKYQINDPFKSGIGFPIGLSINECAAHWTPNPGEKRVLEETDLVKVDFGVHYDGCIIDSAFSFSLSDKYDALIKIGKDADIVLWTDNPLSVYAKVTQTYVDGKLMFDVEFDKKLQTRDKKERIRIIKLMSKDRSGSKKIQPKQTIEKLYHCDTEYEE